MIGSAAPVSDGEGLAPGSRISRSGFLALGFVLAGLLLTPAIALAADELRITNVRVPASAEIGVDVPLMMSIRNDAAEADVLLRVRCPFANFSERHTVDRGEGAPAMRAIKSIPIPENKTTELKHDGHHVMLLQTRQKLVVGETLTCAITFQKAGTKETEVQVSQTP
jgi:periplasmic copper chaperone A